MGGGGQGLEQGRALRRPGPGPWMVTKVVPRSASSSFAIRRYWESEACAEKRWPRHHPDARRGHASLRLC